MPTDSKSAVADVLVVDDHFLTRTGLKLIVDAGPHCRVVGEAETGVEAVARAAQLTPHIILMDVSMPKMDGIEAARRIKESHPAMGIIMLSSNENEEAICASLAAGASGYCLKDVRPERLYAAICSVHEGDVWLDAAIAAKVLKYHVATEAFTISPATGASGNPRAVQSGAADGATNLSSSPGIGAGAAGSGTAGSGGLAAGSGSGARKMPLLSARESEVIHLLVEGLSNQEIADRLVISLPTAKSHVRSILNKLAVDDRTQAAVQAMRRGLV
jgi:DNA-binding NarL/FixJ family response regulator